MFFGSHKELSLMEEEAVQSPIRVTINKFFHKKLAIVALSLFIAIFAFCFVGSSFTEGGEMYMDIGQMDTAPGFGLMAVPRELKKNGIKKIATATTYSVGIDNNGKIFVWGNSLKDLFEGHYQTTVGEKFFYTKVDAVTGEYVKVDDYDDVLSIKKSIKLINQAGLKAKDVYAGPDSFFIIMEDNSVRGYGLKGDSISFSSTILTEDLMKEVKKDGIYNITMDNQVVALMTNSKEGATHKLHIWGNIGIGKYRTQVPSAIIREIEKEGLNPIDLRWTRDTLVILFDNGTYRAYGSNETIAVSAQPSSKIESLKGLIKTTQLGLIDIYKDQLSGLNDLIGSIEAKIEQLEAELEVAKVAELEAKMASLTAKTNMTNAENALKADPENVDLQKAYDDAVVEYETKAAALEAATLNKETINANIKASEDSIEPSKLTYADQAIALAKASIDNKAQVEKLEKWNEEVKANEAKLEAINTIGIKQIRATKGNVIVLLNNGVIITWGDNSSNENMIPEEYQGHFVSIQGDTKGAEKSSHIYALTDTGEFVGWGSDANNALKMPSNLDASQIYSNYYQNFAVDEDGKLVAKWGLSGYTFGTDNNGRSIFLRVMHGGKISLTIGLIAVIISTVIGIIVGGVAGFYGGWVDILMMRLCEIVGSIPFMPIAMTLALVCNELGFTEPKQRMMMIMVILGVLSWTGLASLIRAHILAEREKEFVTAAQAIGVKNNKIIFRHIIPNVITIIIISVTGSYAGSLLTESGLSFLGFGVEPPTPSWGNMLTGAQNMNVIRQYWWRWVFPSVFLCGATISINLIGDCIRDAIDPRSTER